MPEKQTKNSKALDLNDPTSLNSFLLVSIVGTHIFILKKLHHIRYGIFYDIEFLGALTYF